MRRTQSVDSLRIDHDGAHKSAELDQMMTIPTIPRKAESLNAQDCSYWPATNLCDQALKTRAFDKAGCRFAQVLINGNHIGETKLTRILGKIVLTTLAFEVVDSLDNGGLPHVHNGLAAQMVRRDFVAHNGFLRPSSASVPAALSKRSAKTCSTSFCFSAGTGTTSSRSSGSDNCRANGFFVISTVSPSQMKFTLS